MQYQDPREMIDRLPMSAFQWRVVAIMIGLNALDGFDVLSISFASPAIAQAWKLDRAALGVVLSMELVGMALGSLSLGSIADRIGRRLTILGCLVVMAAGMFGAASAGTLTALCIWRVLTGLGIGGMLAAINAAVAEVSNSSRRSLCVVLMAAGYPVGTVVGGSIASFLLLHYEWPAVFIFGAVVTLIFIPLVLAGAPESVAFLVERQPARALDRVNATLKRMGHSEVDALPPATSSLAKVPLTALFSTNFARTTGLLTLAYLAHVMTFYFLLKWIPKSVVDMGHSPAAGGSVLVWASLGGAFGSLLLGLLTARVRLVLLTIAAMVSSTALVALFGQGANNLGALSLLAASAGFVTNAGVVGLYALIAQSFPDALRATATGFVIGIGRGGSALAPALAGMLLATGFGLPVVALVMGIGSLVAAAALLALPPVVAR